MTKGVAVGLGFAPHSGWAVAVGVVEAQGGFRAVVRERVEMTEAEVPESRQPYHAVEGLPVGDAAKRLAAWAARAEEMATGAVRDMGERLGRDGCRIVGVGVLESAGRKGKSLADTLASHALIHTADGDHFRAAIAGAAAPCGLAVVRVPARDLASRVEAATGLPSKALGVLLGQVGREMGPPWTSDQKSAALLAWLVLKHLREGGRGQGG